MAALTRFPVTAKWIPVGAQDVAGTGGLQPWVTSGGIIRADIDSPAGILPALVPFKVVDGELYAADADPETDDPGVSLIADTEVLGLDEPLYYHATFSLTVGGKPFRLSSFVFQAPTDTTTVVLTSVGHVSVNPGVPVSGESTDIIDGGTP